VDPQGVVGVRSVVDDDDRFDPGRQVGGPVDLVGGFLDENPRAPSSQTRLVGGAAA
jgi:hypothetical protein